MSHNLPDLEQRLRHFPPRRRRELAYVVKLLLENFRPAELPRANAALRRGRILKIILFGSYARGKQVMDRKSGYKSDYDLLIIVNNKEAAAPENWDKVEDILIREELELKRIQVPVEIIVHSYHEINAQLKVGRPFFLDILYDGIPLYAEPGYPLADAGNMTEKQQYEEAEKYFNEYYEGSLARLAGARFYFERSKGVMGVDMRYAAFEAHQATETIYHCLLLTLMLYTPKLHNLNKLRSMANFHAPELISVWPRDKRAYRRCFELLRRAYVEGRYSPHYKITALQLQWLLTHIETLQERVKQICQTHLQAMAKLSRNPPPAP